MPEKTQQFAQNIARSLIGEEAAHPAQPLIQMQGIRKSYYIGHGIKRYSAGSHR